MLVDHISWQLDDDTCTALSSDALPTTPPVLEDWESIFGLTLTGSNSSDPIQYYLIRAHVTKATKSKAGDVYLTMQPILIWLLEQFPNIFPIIRHLIGLY